MGERYYLGVYWGDRRESIDASAERTVRALEALAAIDPLFSRWFVMGDTKQASLARPVEATAAGVKGLFRERQTTEPKPEFEEIGFMLDLWNGGEPRSETCRFLLTVGAHLDMWNAPAPNSCLVQLPHEMPATLLDAERLTKIIVALARAFDADWGTVSTDQHLMASAGSRPPGSPHVGWMTFLAAARGKAVRKLPPGARAVVEPGLGVVYVAAGRELDWPSSAAVDEALMNAKVIYPTGSAPEAPVSAEAPAGAYAAALDFAAVADAIAARAPASRARRADELSDAAAALVVAVALGEDVSRAAARARALVDLAHRLGWATDEEKASAHAELEKLEESS